MTAADRPAARGPVDRPLRLLRSVAAALVCVTASAVGHHLAGGVLPAGAVVAVFTGSSVVAWILSSRRVTPGQLLGLLVLCQVGVHLGASSGEMTMGAGMVAAHVVATVVSVAALTCGESFAWRVAERLGPRIAPLLRLAGVVPPRLTPAPVVASRSLRDVRLSHSHWLRGPPVGLV